MAINNTCVCCGEIIPEGIQVCPICMGKYEKEPTNDDMLRKIKILRGIV